MSSQIDENNVFLCIVNQNFMILNKSQIYEDVVMYQDVNGFKLPVLVKQLKPNIEIINSFKSQNDLIKYIEDGIEYKEIKAISGLNKLIKY